MAAEMLKSKKVSIQNVLATNPQVILDHALGEDIITSSDYINIKKMTKATPGEQMVELVDKVRNKELEEKFVNLLRTDSVLRTFPKLIGVLNVPPPTPGSRHT